MLAAVTEGLAGLQQIGAGGQPGRHNTAGPGLLGGEKAARQLSWWRRRSAGRQASTAVEEAAAASKISDLVE